MLGVLFGSGYCRFSKNIYICFPLIFRVSQNLDILNKGMCEFSQKNNTSFVSFTC